MDQIFGVAIGSQGPPDLGCRQFLARRGDGRGEPADGMQNIDGRVVTLGAELPGEDEVAVEDAAYRVADRLVEIVALHQHGEESQ